MSLFQPLRRATLLYPSGPAHDINRKHLFILLTDPVNNPENGKVSVLLTSLSTLNPVIEHDPTFILYPGDHPFVTHNSYVSYAHARIEEAVKLINGVSTGEFIARELMDSRIVDEICNGLSISRHTPPKILRFYKMYTTSFSKS